jgi:Domain of unknown function (DUF305)
MGARYGYGHIGGWYSDDMGGRYGMIQDRWPRGNNNRGQYQMHNMTSGTAMSMSMNDMSKMLEGKTGDDLNKAFLEGMIPHHQAAVDMAKYLAASNKPELVKLGADIITAQTKEIEQMKKWMKDWGYTQSGTTNTGTMMHSGMMMHM